MSHVAVSRVDEKELLSLLLLMELEELLIDEELTELLLSLLLLVLDEELLIEDELMDEELLIELELYSAPLGLLLLSAK